MGVLGVPRDLLELGLVICETRTRAILCKKTTLSLRPPLEASENKIDHRYVNIGANDFEMISGSRCQYCREGFWGTAGNGGNCTGEYT